MRFPIVLAGILGSVMVLAACAPKEPPPIMPEPVYDKYGNAVIGGGDGGQCRSGQQSTRGLAAAVAALPICAGSCGAGMAVSANRQQCVPINQNQPGGDRQPNNPQQGRNPGKV